MEPGRELGAAETLVENCKQAGATELDLSGLDLHTLPESLGNLSQLTELDLRGNQLATLPESLRNLTQLTHLNLAGNRLTALPESLGNLSQLAELDLGGNQLATLPESLRNLTQLTHLDLAENRLTALPESLGNLSQLTELDLSGNQLATLPESLGNLTQLTHLYLDNNGLTALSETLSRLIQLTELHLGGNQLTSVPEALGNLTQLTRLDLDNNRLTAIPETLGNLTELSALYLTANKLTAVPEFLSNFTRLTELYLGGNQLTDISSLSNLTQLAVLYVGSNQVASIPESLSTLTRLTELNLYGNRLTSIPESLKDLTQLTELHLGGNQLTSIPESLKDLTQLTELYLGGNQLTSIPESLGNLTQLTILDVRDNQLTSIPESLGNLTQLTELDLASNRLTNLPESLSNLTQLTELNLYENDLTSIPESLGNLTRLTLLRLDINRLTVVPESLGNLTHLTRLDLDNNGLTSIPESLGNLTELTMLYLFENQLTSLPESLGNLAHLNTLNLSGNRLTFLPESLGNLTQLAWLDLNGNRLTFLPESLGNLTQLTELYLSGNRLTFLPESLGNLTQLFALNLNGNQLMSPPPEIISAGAQAVVSFLAEMGRDPVHQWASKVVVVGEGRVGKTSLLRAIRGETHNHHEASTHGLTVDSLDLAHPNTTDSADVTMHLSTWDFGGQEIYHATHQFFLTDRSLFLLLWDAQIGWEGSKLHYWLDMIKARAPQAPVVLVATHLGPRPPDLPLTELKEAYPGLIVESLAADSASREGVEGVRECIRREAARLPLMGATWPRRWLQAADAVRAAESKHVEPEQLYTLMAEQGVTEGAHQQALTAALHSLGDLLFYPDDEELCDLVVLRPQWLTAYISRVLDSEKVLESGGLFSHTLGNEIWQDVERAMRRHFIRMMENFDLSYRTEDRMSSLVVELLPWDPPPYQERWDAVLSGEQRELRLRYRMHTVPPGIPTWFIAREHRFSTGLRWRSGALLANPDGEHFGLIMVDRHAKAAEIRVRGPYPHDFFAVLKDGFEQTLQRYPGLEITRLVPCPHKDVNGNSCPHEFPHKQLVMRLARKPPRENIECPEHLEDLDVRMLLQGIEPPTPRRSEVLAAEALAKLNQLHLDTQQHHEEIRGRFDQATAQLDQELERTRAEVSAVLAEQQRGFLAAIRREQSRSEVLCPSLVWVRRMTRRRIAGLLPGEAFQLHLCCEAPGEWHLLADVEPYEVPAASEFTISVLLPYVQRTLSVLKYVVPVFGAGLGIASEEMSKILKDDIELMKSLLEGLPDEMQTRMSDGQVQSMVRAEDHAEYRRMYQLLKQLDPDEVWGGLNKITTPEGHTYWLCRQHAQTYRPSTSAIETVRLQPLPAAEASMP
ncbi:leucine-rich repeat domain-containing protein [Streptomyces mirabilis]|uniref:leucine-rich repeat domain-containing protein n=1 Tax=Streptomyces mirabilis TaxID=68239 RepID=UPI00339E43CA